MTQVRTPPRLLHVTHSLYLGPHLRRIFLAGPALAGFPLDSDGAHVRLMFPQPHQTAPVLPTLGPDGPVWPPDNQRPVTRTYSVAHYDVDAGELAIDFVLHGDSGPASRWAASAVPGAALGVVGPAGPPRHRASADWFLLSGDLSALAAVAAVLRALPRNARGVALLEVADPADRVALEHPAGVDVRWLVRGATRASDSRLMLAAIRALVWPSMPSVTLAGENAQVVAIRDHLLQERGVPRSHLYAIPYWKDTLAEEAYHAERHRVMDEFEAWPLDLHEFDAGTLP